MITGLFQCKRKNPSQHSAQGKSLLREKADHTFFKAYKKREDFRRINADGLPQATSQSHVSRTKRSKSVF